MIIIKASDDIFAGICHQKEILKDYSNQWLNYFGVENLETSIKKCQFMGGSVIDGPLNMRSNDVVIIEDPQGAFFAISNIELRHLIMIIYLLFLS